MKKKKYLAATKRLEVTNKPNDTSKNILIL